MTYDPELVERAMKLVKDMSRRAYGSDGDNYGGSTPYQEFKHRDYDEAREIVALLPDEDLEAAEAHWNEHRLDDCTTRSLHIAGFLAGIKHGRTSKQGG